MEVGEQAKELLKMVGKEDKLSNTKFLTVASGKGGVGKTNFAVNFAYILSNTFGKKVLLVDADMGMANVHILVNVDTKKTLKDILSGNPVEEVIFTTRGIDILPGFSGIDMLEEVEETSVIRLVKSLDDISSRYDYIIIDTGAGIDNKIISFIKASSKTYVITTPEPTAVIDAYALIKSVKKIFGYKNFKMIVNMVKNKNEGIETFEKIRASAKKFLDIDLSLMGILPNTKNMKKSVKNKQLIAEIYPSDDFVRELKVIASSEIGEPPPQEDVKFWEKVINFLRRD
ncbi:MinD/ParA family protein [Persephonella sp.]